MKYKEIIKIIKNISLALPDVQSFYTGDVYEVNADQSVKYSSVVLTNQEHSFDNINDKFQYNFILFYIDRLTDDEANRVDVHTAAVSALKTIVRHLEDYNVIINDFKFNLFRERFNDSCAGAYASLSVDVEDNDCNDDFDFTYGQISPDKLKEISITSNGTYTPDEGYYYTKIDVNVPIPEPKLGSLIATQNDYWYIASSENLDGYEAVNVSVPEPKLIDHTAIYVENGSYSLTPKNADGFSKVNVRVNVPNPQLTVLNATENGHYEAVDSGYYGYSAVEVNVPTPEFTTSELVATENGIYRASQQGVDGFYAVMVDVSQTAKCVVPNGMKFAFSSAINPEDFDVSKVTNMNSMFYNCSITSLDLTGWDTSNVTKTASMFNNCSSLASLNINNLNVGNVTDMYGMFTSCYKLTSLDLSGWDVSKVTDMGEMFYYCKILTSLNLSNWNMSNVTSMASMFKLCNELTDLNMNGAILPKINLTNWLLDYNSTLTTTSLESVLNALQQLSEGESYTCSLGATNLAKLTDEQIAIATSKGWTLS